MEIIIVIGVLALATIVVVLSSMAVTYVMEKAWNDESVTKAVMKIVSFIMIIGICLYLLYDVASICWSLSMYGWIH